MPKRSSKKKPADLNKPAQSIIDAAASESQPEPPDGRGPRPSDPNELAKWIVDQTADDDDVVQSGN